MKIRSHLYMLALGAMVPLLIVSVVAGIFLVRHDHETFRREALGRARSAMSAVEAELRGAITTTQALAASKHLANGDMRAFHEEARRVLATQLPQWRNIGLASASRVQLIDANRPYGAHVPFGADDKSFDAAIRTRVPAIGAIIAGPAVQNPAVRIRVPVIVGGDVRYVLSVPIDPAVFEKVLAAQQLPEGWVIALVDLNKKFIARIPAAAVGTPASKDFQSAIARAPEGWFEGRTLEGDATYTPYVTSPVSGWVLGIAIPAKLVEAGAWRTLWLTVTGVLFALAVALALAALMARRIAGPVAALAVAARGVSTGADVGGTATRRIEEIAQLHDALRDASRAVHERQALLESEQATLREQAALLDLTHDAIMVRTTDGTITFWSSGAEDMYGWRKDEALGQNSYQLLHTEFPRSLQDIEAEIDRLARWEGTLRHTRRDGSTLVVASRWALRREQSGKAGIILEIDTDITRQTTAEEAIAGLNHELVEASKRKDYFLATLAHELRNPLAPIKNCVAMLKSDALPARDRAHARDVIERQVAQMARLLDDLLDVSRITHGKLELRRERVTLAQVVETAVETTRPLIKSGGHELIVELGPHPLYLHADPIRLAQIISNLLTNAVKYSNDGTRIWVSADGGADEVVVSVRDEGIGISAEMLPRVFEIFTQADASTNRPRDGMGIGLALVRALAELHGGTVSARSAGKGRGSEFIVRLPKVTADDAPAATGSPASGPLGIANTTFLVADDLADSADSLALLLRSLGNEVRTVYDGEQAFAAAESFRPRVALLDIGMPRINGYDLARKIRAQPWGKDMLLIALSGWGQQEDRRRSREAGFTHHLVKPLDVAELTALMKDQAAAG